MSNAEFTPDYNQTAEPNESALKRVLTTVVSEAVAYDPNNGIVEVVGYTETGEIILKDS